MRIIHAAKMFLAILLAGSPLVASAQYYQYSDYTVTFTIANIPQATSYKGMVWMITDGSTSTDCTTGGGTNFVFCYSNGLTWTAKGSGGGGGANTPATSNLLQGNGSANGVIASSVSDNGTTVATPETYSAPQFIGTQAYQGIEIFGVNNAAITGITFPAAWEAWVASPGGTIGTAFQMPSTVPTGPSIMTFAAPSTVNNVSQSAQSWNQLNGNAGGIATSPTSATANDVATLSAAGAIQDSGNALGSVSFTQVSSTGSAPSCTVGAAAGTGATCSVTGHNMAHVITVNTGTSTTASATLVTITFNGGALSVAPIGCGLTPVNVNAVGQATMVYTTTPSTTTYTLAVAGSAIPASTTGFSWYSPCY